MSTTRPTNCRLLLVGCLFSLAGGAFCLKYDLPVARFFATIQLPGDLRRLLQYSEVFGHGMGVALIVLTATVLDWQGWKRIAVLCTYAFGAGLLADLCKLLISRHRPFDCDLSNSMPTFITWLPLFQDAPLTTQTGSFVSGHTATAVGLALGLSRFYPRAALLFAGFAGLASLQRITELAHFPSDVCFAAAMAIWLGYFLNQPRSFVLRWAGDERSDPIPVDLIARRTSRKCA